MKNSKEYLDNASKFKAIEKSTILDKIFKNKKIKFSDTYDTFDCVYEEGKAIIELKNRFFTSKWFDDKYNGEMLLEKGKCDRLLELVNNGDYIGYKACYLFYFTNDVYQYIVINDIDFEELEVIDIKCPKTSFVKNSEYILKPCYKIPKSIYTKNNFVRRKITH